MVRTLSLEEAVQNLDGIVANMSPEDEITVTKNAQIVCRILPPAPKKAMRRGPGSAKGTFHIIKEDDSHLEDFKEYM